jgi:hypothetical protein
MSLEHMYLLQFKAYINFSCQTLTSLRKALT